MKDDRDNVTRQQKICKKRKNGFKIRNGFLAFIVPQGSLCMHLVMVGQAFLSITCHLIFLYHARHQVKYLMLNLFSKVKEYGRPMGSSN